MGLSFYGDDALALVTRLLSKGQEQSVVSLGAKKYTRGPCQLITDAFVDECLCVTQ